MRSATLRRRYLKFGDGHNLAQHLVFMTGSRQLVERYWLQTLGRFSCAQRVSEQHLCEAWSQIVALVGLPSSAFLLDTSYYKATTLVGPVMTQDGETGFVRHFRETEKARREEERALQVKSLAAGSFLTASIKHASDSTLVYSLLPHSKARLSKKRSMDLVLRMCEQGLASGSKETTLHQYVDLDRLRAWLEADGFTSCACAVSMLMHKALEPLKLCLAHGDCTPWNIFLNAFGEPCLIDYEEVDYGTPFGDYFHFVVQSAALCAQALKLEELASPLVAKYPQTRTWLQAYLLKSIERDFEKRHLDGRRHIQLGSLIEAKAGYLLDPWLGA